MNTRRRPAHLAAVLLGMIGAIALTAVVSACGGNGGSETKATGQYPRSETLITSGTQWGNVVGFNPYVGNYATGMVGLVNETLVRYDPLKDEYIEWLAQRAEFTGPRTYTVEVRPNVQWSNGDGFTAEDVKFNFELGRFETAFWNDLWQSLASIETSGRTVTFNFERTPNYAQWQNLVWNLPMVNPGQWESVDTAQGLTTFLSEADPEAPVGTGPYVLEENGYDPTAKVVWTKNPDGWWAAEAGVAPDPKPRYIVDLVNSTNTNALSGLLANESDLNNNFLPGIRKLLTSGYGVSTYFEGPPYHLSANTAWLVPNTTKQPLDDPQFRQALAHAIDVDRIVQTDYDQLVLPASPTGLLPTWDKWVDRAAVSEHGFSHDLEQARSILAQAGYEDENGDGFVENSDGSRISLDIQVPAGWSDWESARDLIIASAAEAGIRIQRVEGDFNKYQQDRNTGAFDLVIDNTAQLSDTPWTYYNYLFHLPVIERGTGQTFANFSRFENDRAWQLTRQLDAVPPDDEARKQEIISELQQISMQELPAIPLWYNGVWSQFQSTAWTNWPAGDSPRQYIPCMWRGYLQMTGIDTITHLTPAPAEDA